MVQIGTAGNDELITEISGDELQGLEGNDTLDATPGTGDNTLTGGPGDDELFAGINDLLNGDEGDDTLDARSGLGGSTLQGGVGDDVLFAGSNDSLDGGEGDDTLVVGTDDSTLTGGEGSDEFLVVTGELPAITHSITDFTQGEDTIVVGGLGTDLDSFDDLEIAVDADNTLISVLGIPFVSLVGFTGVLLADDFDFPPVDAPPVANDDTASTAEDVAVIIDVLANDTDVNDNIDPTTVEVITTPTNGTVEVDPVTGEITFTPALSFTGTDTFTYTVDDDTDLTSNEATVTVTVGVDPDGPTPGDDFLPVFGSFTLIQALAGNDTVDASVGEGNNTLEGDEGDDELVAGTSDLLLGEEGNDILDATLGTGNNTLEGGVGDDELFAGTGDSLDGGEGDDTLDATAGTGDNFLEGGVGDDELFAGTNDSLYGGEGSDTLDATSGAGNNTLTGGVGNDFLIAGSNDSLEGVEGDDTLIVGTEDSTLTGGEGSDEFLVFTGEFPAIAHTITDFTQGEDIIGLDGNDDVVDSFDDLIIDVDPDGLGTTISLLDVDAIIPIVFLDGFIDPLGPDDFDPPDDNAPVANDDEVFTAEDVAVTIDVLANDTDAEDNIDPTTVEVITAPENGTVEIDPETGFITFTPALGFIGDDTFTYTVDDETDLTSNVATVTVTVGGLPPVVDPDQEFPVDENSVLGTVVGTVTATDPDGDDFTFELSEVNNDPNGDGELAFVIDETTGELTVNDAEDLDFETTPIFELSVTATDVGGLTSDPETIVINLDNVNEPPVITDDQEFTIDENTADTTVVGTVEVEDPDVDDVLTFDITAGNTDIDEDGIFAFTIDAAGVITVADTDELNFEITPIFNLTVDVADAAGLTDSAEVIINLNDINEAPVFDIDDDDIFEAAENGDIGTEVGTVLAIDEDVDDVVTFAIDEGNIDVDGDGILPFAIDPTTGIITITDDDDLDVEGADIIDTIDGEPDPDSEIVELTISATDDDLITPLATTAVVGVTIFADDDDDGIINEDEPGDSNLDGLLDENQNNVTAIPSLDDIGAFTLVGTGSVNEGFFPDEPLFFANAEADVDSPEDPAPEEVVFDGGFLSFDIEGIDVGEAVTISVLLPDDEEFNTFFIFDNLTEDGEPEFFDFLFDGTTGAEFFDDDDDGEADRLLLHLVDGGLGDSDFAADGVITISQAAAGFIESPELDLVLAPDEGVLEVEGDSVIGTLDFTVGTTDADFVSEVGFVRVDDDNTIDGIAPGDPGFVAAALANGEVLFSDLATPAFGITQERSVQVTDGDNLIFYIVADNSADNVLSGIEPTDVFFSLTEANPDGIDHLQVTSSGPNEFTFAFEDIIGGGDLDFNDFIFNVELTPDNPLSFQQFVGNVQGGFESELIDLTQLSGQEIEGTFVVNREAAFDNFVGFYPVVNSSGAILDPVSGELVTPTAANREAYAGLALSQLVNGFAIADGAPGTEFTTTLDGGTLFAPLIISEGGLDGSLVDAGFENVYFSFIDANFDGVDHIRLLGDNVFGFEDTAGGGDGDFNDIVVSASFDILTPVPTPIPVDPDPAAV